MEEEQAKQEQEQKKHKERQCQEEEEEKKFERDHQLNSGKRPPLKKRKTKQNTSTRSSRSSRSSSSSSNSSGSGSSGDTKCQHCKKPLKRHRPLDDQLFCLMSGKFRCGCGRWRYGALLKIQSLDIDDIENAYPPCWIPDCLTCKENYAVTIEEHSYNESYGHQNGGRKHQKKLCPLCKKREYCSRANNYVTVLPSSSLVMHV